MSVNQRRVYGSSNPTGFTLIEILVSIGIIAILIGILLPVLGRSKSVSSELVCVATIRNASVAFTVYCDRNDGVVPAFQPDVSAEPVGVVGRLECKSTFIEAQYFRGQNAYWTAVLLADGEEQSVIEMTCPSVNYVAAEGSKFRTDSVASGMGFAICEKVAIPSTYRPSDVFYAASTYWRFGAQQQFNELRVQRFANVRHPSRKALLFETISFHHGDRRGIAVADPPAAPVVFADGHAAVRDFSDARPGVPNWLAGPTTIPMHGTENGILGIDFANLPIKNYVYVVVPSCD